MLFGISTFGEFLSQRALGPILQKQGKTFMLSQSRESSEAMRFVTADNVCILNNPNYASATNQVCLSHSKTSNSASVIVPVSWHYFKYHLATAIFSLTSQKATFLLWPSPLALMGLKMIYIKFLDHLLSHVKLSMQIFLNTSWRVRQLVGTDKVLRTTIRLLTVCCFFLMCWFSSAKNTDMRETSYWSL